MNATHAPKSLRGSKLTEVVLRDLEDLSLWNAPNPPLTWANLAARVGVSRQAIERKPEIKEGYRAAKASLEKYGEQHAKPENVVRRTFEQRIASMNAAQTALTKKLDGWLERWASIEYNARTLGVDLDRLLVTPAKPDRV